MSEAKLVEVAAKEILAERTQRYRRNVIGLGVAIIALTELPFVKFSGLRLLGLELDQTLVNPEQVIVSFLWILLFYNALIYGWFTGRDWRVWRYPVIAVAVGGTSRYGFPQIKNYFGFKPDNADTSRRAMNAKGDLETLFLLKGENGDHFWRVCRIIKQDGYPDEETLYSAGVKPRKIIKQKVWQFALLEVGFPVLLIITALVSTVMWYC